MDSSPPHLNLVVLRSSDVERAAKFHREMGLVLIRHAHGSGPEHYAAEVGEVVFEIYPATSKYQSTVGMRVGFRVYSVDAVVTLLSNSGAEVISPPADSEWGRRAVVKDFDGHVVELLAPKGG